MPYEQRAGTIKKNRILVQDGVYDAFTKRLAEIAGGHEGSPMGSRRVP